MFANNKHTSLLFKTVDNDENELNSDVPKSLSIKK
jgi:hypothetical protein